MAESPAHKFGQIIGDILEAAVEPLLRGFAEEHGLDYVLERDGSNGKMGKPVAFIETAWRRYTKHSRNKAQEIQGALMPLLETHKDDAPFLGAILAGVFTDGALV